ncbi:DNA-binding protein [Lactococcus lactis]|uniref:DNA-binding protein n=1 Tax=Lactococcus lactis TaxID=1358 RepID=UPI00223C13A5|nr:DNA-binding protein [Lactococcus lactis]
MSEDLKTIKELADELGLAKQTVQYHIKFLPTENRQKNNSGSIVLNLEEQKFIKKRLTKIKKVQPTKNRQKNEELSVNSLLLEQIKDLKNNRDKQLENKDKQLLQMQNLLDQQQRLALQDKKLLEEYKADNDRLKALKMPQEDMKDGSSIRGEAQEEIERLKAQLKLSEEERNKAKEKEPVKTESKKWWKFWK